MLTILGNTRLLLCQSPVDMRKSFEGLSSIVEKVFLESPLSGAFFIFLNKRRDRMKVLFWDNDGLVIWYKRLEKGTFAKKPDISVLNRREFLMLLEGIVPKRLQHRHNIA